MTYIDYMNQSWRVALDQPITASELALYAFLVNMCNTRYWNMPVPCSTVYICEKLRMSKQTVMTARSRLAEKGLIKFSEGKSRYIVSEYSLLELTANLTHDWTLNNKDKEKEHFKPQNLNSRYDSASIKNKRKAVEVFAASAEDYEAAF